METFQGHGEACLDLPPRGGSRSRSVIGSFAASDWNMAPTPRQKLVDAIDLVLGDTTKHVRERGLRVDAIELCGLCRAPNYAERKKIFKHLR